MKCRCCLIFALLLIFATVSSAGAEKRVALVIGNGAYKQAATLANPINDAGDVARILAAFGFEVIIGIDLDRQSFGDKLRAFSRALKDADAAVLFYAGHGLQVAGRNYLIPIDAALETERDLDFEAIELDFVIRQMEVDRAGKTNIIFLDACRDNPLARNLARSMGTRSASVGHGLAEQQSGVGTFIAFSTQPGNVAIDGSGRNSPFTAALAKRMLEPGHNLTTVMIDVRKDVIAATAGRQVPWDHSALTSDFYFQSALITDAAGEPNSSQSADALKQRLKAIEEELKKASDPQHTAKVVLLAELRERAHRLEEAIKEDQERIFETYRTHGPDTSPEARTDLNMQIGRIQLQMTRRGAEKQALSKQIAELEAALGLQGQP